MGEDELKIELIDKDATINKLIPIMCRYSIDPDIQSEIILCLLNMPTVMEKEFEREEVNMENKKVTVCLEALFNRLTGHDEEEEYVPTQYGYIQKETDEYKEWFDFKNDNGTPCMDGETCEIIEETEQYIVLQEIDEKIPFKLSRKEFEIATVECQ